MKILLGIVVLFLLFSGHANAVQDRWLSIWYNNCSEAGHGHEYCKCNVEVIDEKLTINAVKKLHKTFNLD